MRSNYLHRGFGWSSFLYLLSFLWIGSELYYKRRPERGRRDWKLSISSLDNHILHISAPNHRKRQVPTLRTLCRVDWTLVSMMKTCQNLLLFPNKKQKSPLPNLRRRQFCQSVKQVHPRARLKGIVPSLNVLSSLSSRSNRKPLVSTSLTIDDAANTGCSIELDKDTENEESTNDKGEPRANASKSSS